MKWVAGPKATTADIGALVVVHERHTAVTLYSWVPSETFVSLQLVTVEVAVELGQLPSGAPPSRLT
jgi:hypothetical protein